MGGGTPYPPGSPGNPGTGKGGPGVPGSPQPPQPVPSLTTSDAGLALIKQAEGLRLTAYKDAAGLSTIGYGHLIQPADNIGTTITEAEASHLLLHDVITAEQSVKLLVRVPLTQGQFDALVSFTFNLGIGSLRTSTLLRKLNDGDYDGAADELPKWNHAAGKVMAGLTRRRLAELALWHTGDFRVAPESENG